MAIISKKPETLAAKAAESKPVEKTVAPEVVKPAAEKPAKAPKVEKKAAKAEKKVPKVKAEKAAKAPKAKAEKAPKAAKTPAVQVYVEYQGRQVSQETILSAVKADWNGAAIKSLEVYVKPEDGAAYYVVNGEGTGKVEF